MAESNLKDDIANLYEQLKFDHTSKVIEKNTLECLMLYCDVDSIDPLFFAAVTRKLESTKKDQLTLADLMSVFDFSKDPFTGLSIQELTQFWRTFDLNNNGEIKFDEFLQFYLQTPEYKANPNKEEAKRALMRDFDLISPQNRSITPQEFLELLNNAAQKPSNQKF